MKVFISWSGELSRELAEAFRNWLPSVLQVVRPYFTPSDIEKGARWSSHIAQELAESRIGVFCLTRENLSSAWIMFEAGAISKVVGDAHVCPILFGLEASDLTGPLSQFQVTQFNKTDMHKLISAINEESGEQKLLDQTRDSVFEMWWPKLENQVAEILKKYSSKEHEEIRSDREILEEILSLARLAAKEAKADQREKVELSERPLARYVDLMGQRSEVVQLRRELEELQRKIQEQVKEKEYVRRLLDSCQNQKEEAGSGMGKAK